VRVFISYRRNDSGGHVQALARTLQDSLIAGEACEIFIDVDDISPGARFRRGDDYSAQELGRGAGSDRSPMARK